MIKLEGNDSCFPNHFQKHVVKPLQKIKKNLSKVLIFFWLLCIVKTTPVIVLADTHTLALEATRFYLEDFGYTVPATTNSGGSLISYLSTHPLPDICMMDIRMPDMDGFVTAQFIKERWPSVKVLMYSLYDLPMYQQKAFGFGADGYLSKSASLEMLKKEIERLVN